MVEKPYGSGFRVGESKESGEKWKMKKFPDFSSALMSMKEWFFGKMVEIKKLATPETLLHAKFQVNRSQNEVGRTGDCF